MILLTIVATLALQDFFAKKPNSLRTPQQNRIGISLLVFAGVIFRSEIALLLFVQLGYLLVQFRIPLRTVIYTGLTSFVLAQAISIPIDSYLWQRLVWPELSAFLFNVVQGKSGEWGTSPYGYYFGSLLPKLLVNPLILILLIPLSYIIPAIKFPSRDLVTPSILFIAIYSFQPHKEARFIIYVVPALTAAASLSASYIWTRRSKSILYRLGSLLITGSIVASFAASTIMLLISCLNYPGGEALSQLHHLLGKDPSLTSSNREQHRPIRVHMDVLSCMTGVTRFQQYPSFDAAHFPEIAGRKTEVIYDKTEDSDELLQQSWWDQFDFALMEEPGKAIGPWEVIGSVYSYAGLEFLRPGVRSLSSTEKLYGAYNSTKEGEGVLGSEEVVEKVKEMKDWRADYEEATTFLEVKERVLRGGLSLSKAEIVWCVRDAVRLLTGGWWIGPRLEPKIRILTRGEVILP
jgi:alpha-1,6-mannosyltransferase